jgi:adenylylsulfate kinase-like enzyme
MCRRFIEVYVSTPLAECERRDPKGVYAAGRRGDISDVIGIHTPYEASPRPELVLCTTNRSIDQSVACVLREHTRVAARRNGKNDREMVRLSANSWPVA